MDTFTKEQRSEIMSRISGKDTTPELLVRRLLHRLGLRFRLHRKDLPGKPDIVLPKRKTVVFVHGCFWHGHDCPRGARPEQNADFWAKKLGSNVDRDRRVQAELVAAGWRVIVVWQCMLKRPDELLALLDTIQEPHAHQKADRH